ncbi:hypothetical protein MKQ70_22295 [Chitinophaga sedimenti]|uniref:hypothetical protein n=1 Tax=Chitinophaga sedimenti TaxID=2033606 RepID=UPI00200574C2|nr:hypothetical protein [Chitinophaga sedimenti]MCK7557584.1 hypothetical protein [Chitinophaga sedimenti]
MFNGKLRLNANLSGYQQTYFSGSDGGAYRGDVYRNGLTYNPTDPVKDENGNWTEHTDKTAYANPVSLLMETNGKNENTNFRTIGTLTYSPIKGLDIMLLGSRNLDNSVRGYYESKNITPLSATAAMVTLPVVPHVHRKICWSLRPTTSAVLRNMT